jgi:ParB-like chromosome segregation protein Spo0J
MELEKYEIVKLSRSAIHMADYNPRRISSEAKKKLKAEIKRNGLVQPIIVNKRTMAVVSGHQRLAIADELIKKPDYEITCALIDVDEKQEVALNVALNNQSLMGEWDIGALKDLGELFPDIDFEADMGFDSSDIEVMFGKEEKEIEAQIEREKAEELTTDAYREAKKKSREKAKAENQEGGSYNLADSDYVIQIVFPNNHEKHAFMRKIHKPEKETMLKSTVLYDIASGKLDISVFAGRE